MILITKNYQFKIWFLSLILLLSPNVQALDTQSQALQLLAHETNTYISTVSQALEEASQSVKTLLLRLHFTTVQHTLQLHTSSWLNALPGDNEQQQSCKAIIEVLDQFTMWLMQQRAYNSDPSDPVFNDLLHTITFQNYKLCVQAFRVLTLRKSGFFKRVKRPLLIAAASGIVLYMSYVWYMAENSVDELRERKKIPDKQQNRQSTHRRTDTMQRENTSRQEPCKNEYLSTRQPPSVIRREIPSRRRPPSFIQRKLQERNVQTTNPKTNDAHIEDIQSLVDQHELLSIQQPLPIIQNDFPLPVAQVAQNEFPLFLISEKEPEPH